MDEMSFLKIFADMEELFEPFSAEERGNLFSAIMAYAFHGEDAVFSGNERFLWPVLRRHLNNCMAQGKKNSENGAKGGRPRKATETQKNPEKPKETEQNPKKAYQEQEQEHIQEQEQEQMVYASNPVTITSAPPAPAPQPQISNPAPVVPLIGEELGAEDLEALERIHEAERLLKRFGVKVIDRAVERVSDWLKDKGTEKVQKAFERAADADNRGGLSLNFVETVLNSPETARNGPNSGRKSSAIDFTVHSKAERESAFNAAIVQLE